MWVLKRRKPREAGLCKDARGGGGAQTPGPRREPEGCGARVPPLVGEGAPCPRPSAASSAPSCSGPGPALPLLACYAARAPRPCRSRVLTRPRHSRNSEEDPRAPLRAGGRLSARPKSTTCTAGRNGFVHSATPVYSCSLINASAQQSRPPSSRVWPVCEPQQHGRPGQKRSLLWVHPTPCRTLSIAPGLHPRDANSTSRSCDNPNCLRTPLTGSCRGRGLQRTAVSRERGPASVPVNHAGLGQDGTGDAAFSHLRQALKPSVPGTGL